MPADPLEELVSSAARPLAFLREADPAQRVRTRLPIDTWLARIARLPADEALAELAGIFRRLARDEDRRENALLDRALELLGGLKPRASRDVPAASLPRGTDRVLAQLAALAAPVSTLAGVGPARAAELERFGLKTVEDVLYHLPFRYDDRRSLARVGELHVGDSATVLVTLADVHERAAGRARRSFLQATARDESDALELVWYHQLRFFRSRLKPGSRWLVHGRVERGYASRLRIVHPEMEAAEGDDAALGAPRILPVYEKPTAMPVSTMRRIARAAVLHHAGDLPDVVPEEVRAGLALCPLSEALREIHDPQQSGDPDALAAGRSPYHRAIVFDELFYVQLGLLCRKAQVAREPGIAFAASGEIASRMLAGLPFALTRAQARVLEEIVQDMRLDQPMHRLVQGDVGSGKTVVAVAAALHAVELGYQAALMAPTELLAEQHWSTVGAIAGKLGVPLWALTGQTPPVERRRVLADLANGKAGLIVGTHALIQEKVEFARLGLVVIDEQHRFGVMQRAALSRGGTLACPDVLLMTATPIPRTLALSVYGDLDISTIDELPPGRKPVQTKVMPLRYRERAYDLVRREIEAGRQAYVVYPLIEESEKTDLRNATSAVEELATGVFRNHRVALLHGRMPALEREAVMRGFRDREHDVLVATTVVEVGVDVPNASVMVVEHAERFGLSQLHQLRGRVGRGAAASHCLLLADYAQSSEARERLKVMAETNDGLRIAEADLAIRGPGALLGTRQAGVPDFRVANLLRDSGILREARAAAERLLTADPMLSSDGNRSVSRVLDARWAGRLGLARVG